MVIEVSLKTTTPGSFDLPRSSRMLAIGLFHGAPRHFFYVRLEKSGKSLKLKSSKKLFAGIPGTSLKCAAKKVFFDQAGLCDCYSDGDDEEDKCEIIDTKLTDMTTMIVQAVLSVFIDTTFLFGMPLLEGRGPSAGLENIKDKYTSHC